MESFQVIVGVDWADERHAVCLIDQEKGLQESCSVEQTPEALTEWVASLRKRFSNTPIAVCLEQKRGALIYALMKYEFLVLVPVNPKQLARYLPMPVSCRDGTSRARWIATVASTNVGHGSCAERWWRQPG